MGKLRGSGYGGLLEAFGMGMVMVTVKPARAATGKGPTFFSFHLSSCHCHGLNLLPNFKPNSISILALHFTSPQASNSTIKISA